MPAKISATRPGQLVAAALLIIWAHAAACGRRLFAAAFLPARVHPPTGASGGSTPLVERPGRSAGARPSCGAVSGAASSSIGALAEADAAALPLVAVVVLAGLAAGRRVRRDWSGAVAARRAVMASGGGGGFSCAADAAALERAAAQLRADVAKIEAELEEQRRLEQAKWFRIFDTDGSGAVDVAELRRGMMQVSGAELSESMALRLMEALDEDRDGLLQPAEFDVKRLEATLEKLVAEDRALELEAWRAERRQRDRVRAEAEAERLLREYEATLPPANQDVGALTRLGSVLVYLLPLMNALKFGVPLATSQPLLKEAFAPLLGLLHSLSAVPYGQLLAFIVLQTLADNRDLPLLLRFNMRQAVVLDIALGTLQLLQVVAAIAMFGQAPPDIVQQWDSNTLVFLALLGCIGYSVVFSLRGEIPRGIPGISAYAERYMAPTRPLTRAVGRRDDNKDLPSA